MADDEIVEGQNIEENGENDDKVELSELKQTVQLSGMYENLCMILCLHLAD